MKKICLCFQIHQPYRLRRYRFFDIGNSHYYTDDYLNEEVFERIADSCYIPANHMLLELLKAYPDFRVSFSISGLALEQMEYYKPALIDSFKELAATGRVEFVAETYAHSVASGTHAADEATRTLRYRALSRLLQFRAHLLR